MHLFLSILMIFAIANVSFAENVDEICFTTIMIIILSIHIIDESLPVAHSLLLLRFALGRG